MARVTLVTGQAQQGKTTLALAILRREAVRGLILDPVRSKPFTGLSPTLSSWAALASFLQSPEAAKRWLVTLRSPSFGDYVEALRAAPCYRHVTLLVDEGMMFTDDREALEPLVHLARMNAHFGGGIGVPMLITAQRPNDLPRDVRSQADRWFSFRQEEPGDLEYLSQRCNPEFADRVAQLQQHQYLTFPVVPQQGPQKDDDDGTPQDGAELHAGRGGGARAVTYGAATERGAQAPGPNGGRERGVGAGSSRPGSHSDT